MRKLLLGSSSLVMLLTATTALAQETPATAADPVQDLEAIVVTTGTQIRGVAPVGAPVISVDTGAIRKSGLGSNIEVLRSVPAIANIGNDQRNHGANIGRGSSINLRGIGEVATLILIDGHRAAPSGHAGQFIDAGTVPTVAVGGIEVLSDGASAIYGSDAIAGVVNFILKRNYNGGEVFGRYGAADGYFNWRAGAAVGRKWDGGSLSFAYEKMRQGELRTSERPKLYPGQGTGVTLFQGSGAVPTGLSNFTTRGNIRVGATYYAVNADGVSVTPNAQNVQAVEAGVLPAQFQDMFLLVGNQRITPGAELYGQALYSNRHYRIKNTQGVNLTLTVPSTNPYFIPVPGATVSETVLVQEPINSLQQGGRQSNWQVVLGGRAELPYGWQADLSVNETGSYLWGPTSGGNGTVINSCAMGLSTVGCIGTGAINQTTRALAFNPFGPNSPTLLNSILTDGGGTRARYVIRDHVAKLDGPLFALPAGQVRVALGYERQIHDYDFLQLSGAGAPTVGNPPQIGAYRTSPVASSMHVDSGFVEAVIPLFGDANAAPGVRRLDLSAAVRYDKYSRLSEGTTNPKFGFTWEPTDDLVFRGSYGTSFRYSMTGSLYLRTRTANIIPAYRDFRSATGSTVALQIGGGNPALLPEEARTITFGGRYQPKFLRGFSADLTYFNIKYENIIGSPNPGGVGSALTETLYAPYLMRRPAASDVAGNAAFTNMINGHLNSGFLNGAPVNPATVNLFVNGDDANIGTLKTDGIDFIFSYDWTMGGNDLTVGLLGTYYLNFKRSLVPGAAITSQLGRTGFPQRYRARGNLGLSRGGFSANAFLNYTPGYFNTNVTPIARVKHYATVDLALAYDLGDRPGAALLRNIRFGLSVQDLFDADPPYAFSTSAPAGGVTLTQVYDSNGASPVGRMVSFEIRKRF